MRCFHPGLVAHRVWRFSPELNCRPKLEACHFKMSNPIEWSLYFSIQTPNHEAEWSSSIALPFGRTVDPAMDCTLKPIKGGLQLDHAETFSVFALKESAHPMPWCSGCSGRKANSRVNIFKDMTWVPKKWETLKSISNSLNYNSCPSGLVSNVDQHWRKASRNAFLCFPNTCKSAGLTTLRCQGRGSLFSQARSLGTNLPGRR